MIRAMAAHVLDHGLMSASLRPLAKAADTSDRMLIYHFESKDKLVSELLAALAADLTAKLDAALPLQPVDSQRQLLDEVLAVVRAPVFAAYIRLWHEVIAAAAKGQAAHRATAHAIAEGYIQWLQARMPETEADTRQAAKTMLTVIEGIHVMDSAGLGDVVEEAIERLYPRRT